MLIRKKIPNQIPKSVRVPLMKCFNTNPKPLQLMTVKEPIAEHILKYTIT